MLTLLIPVKWILKPKQNNCDSFPISSLVYIKLPGTVRARWVPLFLGGFIWISGGFIWIFSWLESSITKFAPGYLISLHKLYRQMAGQSINHPLTLLTCLPEKLPASLFGDHFKKDQVYTEVFRNVTGEKDLCLRYYWSMQVQHVKLCYLHGFCIAKENGLLQS